MVPVWMTFSDLWPRFQSHDYSTSNNSKMYNIDLSNGAIFIDLERLIPTVSRSFHFLTQNISEMVRDADSFNGILIKIKVAQFYGPPCVTRKETWPLTRNSSWWVIAIVNDSVESTGLSRWLAATQQSACECEHEMPTRSRWIRNPTSSQRQAVGSQLTMGYGVYLLILAALSTSEYSVILVVVWTTCFGLLRCEQVFY